ncbi:MAG TPA: hypothetical protein VFO41_07380, partial [Alphaproteobacteria bacterium]|nr:hypothetical protein [Alphaproteobacteria bacterium]
AGAMEARQFFLIISVIALATALFSPGLLPATYLTMRFVLPEIFWVSERVMIFMAVLYAAIGIVVVSGVPAALFERIAGRDPGDDITMLVWAVSAAVLAACTWQFLG